MKKYIIIALVVIVGAALLIVPLMKGDPEIVDNREKDVPAVFAFQDNLATVGEEAVDVTIEVKADLLKMEVIYNDSVLKTWSNINAPVSFKLEAGMFGVGTRTISVLSTLKDGSEFVDSRFVRVLSDIDPKQLTVEIVEAYPHNPLSFTQGLEFYQGKLYEGTGDPGDMGKTVIAEVDLPTGEHKASMGLSVGYFGEGITTLNGTLYQLTYKNGKCYTYDLNNSLQLKGEFAYDGEGWGLCNDGESLIMSNGSERLVFRDPETFVTKRTIEVYDNEGPIVNLNELEYIDGKIYANIWTTNIVVVIDPVTGKVLESIDGTLLTRQGRGNGEVMNGIAYNIATNKLYMTGKYWNKLFEVKVIDPLQ